MRNRYRIEMEFDTKLEYEQFRVAALKIAIEVQVPHKIELVYLATCKVDDARHEPIDQR